MAYRWKSQSGMTTYNFASAAIATYEASRNVDPGISYVQDGITYKIHNEDLEGTLSVSGSLPDAPTLTSATAGDGQVTLAVALNAADDPAYAIWRTGSGEWTDPSESFKATEDGNIVVTGLTNGTLYTFVCVSKNGDLYSLPSAAVVSIPDDGSKSELEQCLDAVAASLNEQVYTDSDGDAVTAVVNIPPRVESVEAASILVFPDGDDTSPAPSQANQVVYRVNVVWCELDGGSDQHTRAFKVREMIKDLMVGSRLPTMTNLYCQGEASATSVDMAALMRDVPEFSSGMTLEFTKYRARS